MQTYLSRIALLLPLLLAATAAADDADDNARAKARPLVRIEADGPLSYVTALAFRRDAEDQKLVLHAAGWDKTIHAWSLANPRLTWEYDRAHSLRVPIAPGVYGSENAMAVSPDAVWLAVGGRGVVRGLSGWDDSGVILHASTLSREMQLDLGTILVFHLPSGKVTRLRGHTGSILGLTFASGGGPPVLVSAAVESPAGSGGSLRVWDVAGNRELKSLGGLPERNLRPGLTAWSTGPEPESIRVGIAWADSKPGPGLLRVWDPVANQLSAAESGAYPVTAWALPGTPARLLAGVAGRLGTWTIPELPGGKIGQLNRAAHFQQMATLPGSSAPLAVAAVPAPAGQPADLAAWVVYDSKTLATRLMLIKIATGAVAADVPLWTGILRPPAVAIDPAGQYLAVAGNDRNEVRVYRLQDLLAGRATPQLLRSVAQTLRYVAFAQRDQRLGVAIGTAPPGTPPRAWQPANDQVFDLPQRRLANLQGWQDFNADQSTWQVVTGNQDNRLLLEIRRDGGLVKTILLDKGDSLTAWTFCQPTALFKEPLLAAAVLHEGEPQLLLYSASTGEQLRHLSGHFDRIECLRFSRDGKLLVSAAQDNTICLWWLPDLPESLQAHGALRDLSVEVVEGKIVVKSDRPGRFSPGDLLSVIDRDPDKGPRALSFSSAWEFHGYVTEQKPGNRLSIEVTRAGDGQKVPVQTLVERAIPERKPLCSLFFFSERPGEPLKWIGWDPLGRYDASGEDAERRLGWHFNTDTPEFPVKFAVAEKYREQNYWEGLLSDHLEQGPLIVPRPPPAPGMSLFLREGEDLVKPVAGGPFVARSREVTAMIRLGEFPERLIGNVIWKIGDVSGKFQPVAGGLWEADLDGAALTRAVTTLVAEVQTQEQPPRVFSRELTLRAVPQAPQIEVATPIPEVSKLEKLSFQVAAQSSVYAQEETVALTLVHRHEGKVVATQDWESRDPAAIERQVVLRPGVNLLTVEARGAKATPDTQPLEQVKRSWSVRLADAERPEVVVRGVVRPGESEPVPLEPGTPLVTSQPSLQVRGTMTSVAPDLLTRAYYSVSGNDREIDLTGFKPETTSRFEFSQSLPLVPGLQTFTLTTVSNRKQSDRASFSVDFKPVLPVVDRLTLTQDGRPLPKDNLLIEGRHSPGVLAELQLVPPAAEFVFPHDVELLLRTKTGNVLTEEPLSVKLQDLPATIRHELTLSPGENEFFVVLRNRWGNEEVTSPRLLVYRQPPRILKVSLPAEIRTPEVLFEADIASHSPLTRVAVFTNGFEVPAELGKILVVPNGKGLWKVTAVVPLQLAAQVTDIALSAWNRDGETLNRYRGTTTYVLPPPRVPDLRLEGPVQTRAGELEVRFRIRSQTPLQRVTARITRAGLTILEQKIPIVPGAAPDVSGFVGYRHAWSLDEIGERTFQVVIEAANKGGVARTPPADVNYIPEPPQLIVDELRPLGKQAASLKHKGFRVKRFDEASHGRLLVRGHLDTTRGVDRSARVKIWVNGFLQMSVPVDSEAKFSGEIALNMAKGNRISFELPHLPVQDERLPTLMLDCSAHLPPPRLRLLTVVADAAPVAGLAQARTTVQPTALAQAGNRTVTAGPPVATTAAIMQSGQSPHTPQNLQRRILEALASRNGQALDEFEVVAYPPAGRTPGVMTGDFTFQDFVSVLVYLRRVMQGREDRPSNDVLVVYYGGTEAMDENSDFELRTGNPRSMITRKWLTGFLGEMPGAHLLLLDVRHLTPIPVAATWKRDPRLGLLRVVSNGSEQPGPTSNPFHLVAALEEVVRKTESPVLSLRLADTSLQSEFDKMRAAGILFHSEIPEEMQELKLRR